MNDPAPEPSLPRGIQNAFLFSAFNALSFQVVLGSPMVLYAKGLGARATVLGIIAGMMPLLVIFQIPAANYINRIGYKRFVVAGWGTRVMVIFAIALVPLADRLLGANNQLAVLLVLLFCFNLSRGISSCAWLPWITGLIPPAVRGRYLSRDQAVLNFASFVVFLIGAAVLGETPGPGRFAGLFGFSAVAGAISLSFLKRIPDVPVTEEPAKSRTGVPWLAMLRHPPFWKLVRAVVAWSVAYGGMTAFTVAFLKVKANMPDNHILVITSVSFLGGLSSLWLLGARLDRLGSKPVVTFALAVWIAVMGGWTALAGGALPTGLIQVVALQFLMGLLAALITMATNRLAMAVIPVMGRNHFFALYSVLGSVALGLAPIGLGVLIDAVGEHHWQWLGLDWNRYTVFFAATTACFAATLELSRRLQEPEAASMEELLKDLLSQSRRIFLLKFWPRS